MQIIQGLAKYQGCQIVGQILCWDPAKEKEIDRFKILRIKWRKQRRVFLGLLYKGPFRFYFRYGLMFCFHFLQTHNYMRDEKIQVLTRFFRKKWNFNLNMAFVFWNEKSLVFLVKHGIITRFEIPNIKFQILNKS